METGSRLDRLEQREKVKAENLVLSMRVYVSPLGNVFKTNPHPKNSLDTLVKIPTKFKNGYEYFKFYHKGRKWTCFVHRLVWAFYNGPVLDGWQIDHINYFRDDNRLLNLRMVTPAQNRSTRRKKIEHPAQYSQQAFYGKSIDEIRREQNKDGLPVTDLQWENFHMFGYLGNGKDFVEK